MRFPQTVSPLHTCSRILVDSDDTMMSVSGVEVERVKTLDNLIDQSEQLGEKIQE